MDEKQVFDTETLGIINHFERLTKCRVKDFYEHNGRLFFIIETGKLMQALGKDGANVKKLSAQLNKRIKIAEYNPDIKLFIRNLIHPLRVKEMQLDTPEEGMITLMDDDVKTKGLIIGAKAQNLRFYERIVQKYFPDIKEIRVV